MKTFNIIYLLAVFAAVLSFGESASAGETLDRIKKRGYITCGVGEQHKGFTYVVENGDYEGFDVDFCRALAAAVFGDKERVQFLSLNNNTRFPALQDKEVDVLIRTTTWTQTRDASLGVSFAGVTFYDGQGVMAPKSMGADSLAGIKGAKICAAHNTTTLKNIGDFLRIQNIEAEIIALNSMEPNLKAFFSQRCNLLTDDRSALASIRASRAPSPEDYIIFPEVLSKEPLGPVVRDDDVEWFKVVRWVIFATLEAEELGLTSQNAASMKDSDKPAVRRFLGLEDSFGAYLGLSPTWAADVVSQVGNYEEIFNRNIGPGTTVDLSRGVNRLWTEGGLLYSMPFR